jgi:hypothetical protein
VLGAILIVGLTPSEDLSESPELIGEKVFTFNSKDTSAYILVNSSDRRTYLYDGDKPAQLLSTIPRTPEPILSLPDVKGDMDITVMKDPTSEYTWESDISESVQYLNFLTKSGYTSVRDVHTSQYIEKIMEKGGNQKRIVIFNHIIMVGDLYDTAELPSLADYLKKYKN